MEEARVEVVTVEVVTATVDMVVVVVTELVAAKARSPEQEVEIPFVGETLTGGGRPNILLRTIKDNSKSPPVSQCWPWAMDTISDSTSARQVFSRRTDEAFGSLAPSERRPHFSTGHRWGEDPTDRQASSPLR